MPTLTTLVMGFRFSTLIAQLVHERLLVPLLTRRVRFYRRDFTPSPVREATSKLASASADGVHVPLGRVPLFLLRPILEMVAAAAEVSGCPHVGLSQSGLPESMASMMVPLRIFANVPAPASADSRSCFLLRGWDLRESDLSLALAVAPLAAPTWWTSSSCCTSTITTTLSRGQSQRPGPYRGLSQLQTGSCWPPRYRASESVFPSRNENFTGLLQFHRARWE